MVDGPDPEEPNPSAFPGDAFWRFVESAVSSVGLGSPRTIFRIRKARAHWEERRAANANIGRGVSYTHKSCPACRRLVERGKATCPYCSANVRWAPGPGLMRWLGVSIPHGSAAMGLIAANLLLYGVTTYATMRLPDHENLWALLSPDSDVLYKLGSLDKGAVLLGQVWRLWTYQFLHFGAVHILFNMMALLSLGPTSEDVYGSSKTLVLYWATGILAGAVSMGLRLIPYAGAVLSGIDLHHLVRWGPGTVGASGSIFGLIGLLIGHSLRRGGSQGAFMRKFLVQWAVYGLIMGFALGADNAAHVGGLVSGIVLGLLVSDRRLIGSTALLWRVAAFAVIGLIVLGFAVNFFTEPPQHVPWPGEDLESRLDAPPPPARWPGEPESCLGARDATERVRSTAPSTPAVRAASTSGIASRVRGVRADRPGRSRDARRTGARCSCSSGSVGTGSVSALRS